MIQPSQKWYSFMWDRQDSGNRGTEAWGSDSYRGCWGKPKNGQSTRLWMKRHVGCRGASVWGAAVNSPRFPILVLLPQIPDAVA